MTSLRDKVYAVTGGSSGIGLGVVQKLLELGAKVAASDIQDLPEELVGSPNLKFSKVDVRSRSEVRNWIQDIVHDFQRLDGICSNAGITPIEGTSGATDDDLYDKIFDICTKGVWNCGTEAFVQFKKQGDGGVIVNMASAAGLKAVKNHPVYVGAKHAVVGFTKTWAAMWGSQNIRVNAIAPGTSIHSNCASFV